MGIGTGKPLNLKNLSPEQKAEVVAGVKEGEAKIEQYLESGQKNINGWKVGSLFGDRAFYKGDWLMRAASNLIPPRLAAAFVALGLAATPASAGDRIAMRLGPGTPGGVSTVRRETN